jgi:CheY-like chemotaxis protein
VPTSRNQRLQILVVDDEPAIRSVIKMFLQYDGHGVQTVSSGEEALFLLENSKFDLIITDYSMLDMKGDELAAIIKQRLPAQPIIMISAYAEMLKGSGNPLTGVDALVSKPFLLKDLREAMARVLPGT